VVLLCGAGYPAAQYLRHAWSIFPLVADVGARCEFQTTKWMHDHLPDARAFPIGSIRLWYDAWYNDDQIYGGSNQGMLNQILPVAVWQIVHGEKAELTVAWLQALGADAVIVADNTSQEVYHEYSYPDKFKGIVEAIYDDHAGNVIYRIPRRFAGIARVVEQANFLALDAPRGGDDLASLTRYVAAVEHGPDSPVTVARPNFESVELAASTAAGQAVLLQETFDPAWHAYSEGRPLKIDRDPMGFMAIETPPGSHMIQVRFETPLENRVGWGLTAFTCAFLLALSWVAGRRWVRLRLSDSTAF